jgi:hypothetical protein
MGSLYIPCFLVFVHDVNIHGIWHAAHFAQVVTMDIHEELKHTWGIKVRSLIHYQKIGKNQRTYRQKFFIDNFYRQK